MAASAALPSKPVVSRQSAELLLDLVAIKLSCIEVFDRDDARERKALERARVELESLLGRTIAALPAPISRRGHQPTMGRLAA